MIPACLSLLLVVFFASSVPALAQTQTSTISGLVTTGDGKPIPARIQWIHDGLPLTLHADSDGRFSFNFVSPGFRTFRFSHSSTPTVGVYEAVIELNSSIHLFVVLRSARQGDTGDTWEIRKQGPRFSNAWQPERFLTKSQIESLPSTGHLWSFLNHTEASVVAERYDVAGMHSQRELLFGVRGSSWSQNQGILNGLTLSQPSGDGLMIFPDMTAMEAILYSVGGSPTLHTGPGAHLTLMPKFGEPEPHGQVQLYYQGGALQNVNPSERNVTFNIRESDERWRRFLNGGLQLGGPLGNLPWTYFGAFSLRTLEKHIRNHPQLVSGKVMQASFNLSGQLSPKNRFGFYGSVQQRDDPQAGASPQVTRESSIHQDQNYYAFQGTWTRSISSRSLLDVRAGMAISDLKSQFQRDVYGQSNEDLFAGFAVNGITPGALPEGAVLAMLNNTRRGPAPLVVSSDAGSWEGSAAYSTVLNGFWGSNHRVALGVSNRHSFLTQQNAAVDGVNLRFFMNVPNSVVRLNTPAKTRDGIHHLELYASDTLSFRRLSFALAVSADTSRGGSSLKSGASANRLSWMNIGANIGIAYQPMDRGPMVIRAGISQVYDQPVVNAWTAANPEGLDMRVYSWTDANGDRQFQEGEDAQILKVYGPLHTRMDPDLRNPKTTEFRLGFSQDGHGLKFSMYGFKRTGKRLMSLVNEGVPFSSYTSLQVMDPGWDGILGSADDSLITVFNQNSQTLGQDRYVLTNPEGDNSHSEGFESKLRFTSARFSAEAALTRYRAVAATAPGVGPRENDTSALLGVFDDPNKEILAKGSTYFDRGTLGRIWATAELGWRVRASLIASYQDGLPYSRILPIQGLNQGLIGVLTSFRGPGNRGSIGGPRTSHNETIDIRLFREFSLKRGRLATSIDVFNLLNLSQPLVQAEVTALTQFWRVPLRFETPRSLQLGIRYGW